MGCNDSRPMKIEVEETVLGPFEDSLGYKGLNSIELDNTFHRYSRQGFITLKHLNQALTVSKIPYTQFSEFYELFELSHSKNIYEKLYSTDLLKTLSLMLSKATNEQKILLLFKNYDIEATKVIDKKTVLIMVYNIFFVVLKMIPNYCKKKNPSNDMIKEYIIKLEKNQKNIMTQIYKGLTKGHSPLKFEDFRKNCLNSSVQDLFSVNLLRKSTAEFDKFSQKNNDLNQSFDISDEDDIDIDSLLDEVLTQNKKKIDLANNVNQFKISMAKALLEKGFHKNGRNNKKADKPEKKKEQINSLGSMSPLDKVIFSEIEEIYSQAFDTQNPGSSSTDKFSNKISQLNKDELERNDSLKKKKNAKKIESNEKKVSRKKK
ncbi:hypothetical protein SteCoe_4919 [Stentor coeruleus]|uniref:EF-hand domain-containing protein n=1 Tax=Stentor coeruleus TaxID=5963 RepID=A0A1R2CTL4_9CILI|nr:hypothetical protein SteCoe_4919 [Stentor coeruleus]